MWRVPVNLSLAKSLFPSLNVEQALTTLQSSLIAASGRPIDKLYSRLGLTLTGNYFFEQGWGDLRVVNLEQDLEYIKAWPPAGIKIDWQLIDEGKKDGVAYKMYDGTFKTPCVTRIYDALPPESRTGRVRLLVPAAPGQQPLACAVHLAATGDQGFGRRVRLAFPLLKQGVASIVHESPFYGSRRPAAQKGAKLLRVSDLMTLGWATIYESINLLHWAKNAAGYEGGLCLAGLSMGGVHSCMTASLYQETVAVASLLAPRSASVAYCDGALSAAMAWQPLLKEADEKDNDVHQVIYNAAQPVSVMRAATYALAELELVREQFNLGLGGSNGNGTRSNGHAAATAAAAAAAMGGEAPALAGAGGASVGAVSSDLTGVAADAVSAASAAGAEDAAATAASSSGAGGIASRHSPHGRHSMSDPLMQASPISSSSSSDGNGTQPDHHRHVHADRFVHPPHQQHLQPHASSSSGSTPSSGSTSASGSENVGRRRTFIPLSLDTRGVDQIVGRLGRGLRELVALRADDTSLVRAETNRRLSRVLETYTDITRFPLPKRPDAAVFVAATDDAYVTVQSVRQLHEHWPGSDMRLVSGGHVSAFLMHQDKFRTAILDSLQRLKQPPPAAAAAAAAAAQQQQRLQ